MGILILNVPYSADATGYSGMSFPGALQRAALIMILAVWAAGTLAEVIFCT